MSKLAFICYRRSDTFYAAQGLCSQLRARLGVSQVFMDVGSVHTGEPWPDRIKKSLERADVVLALIGPTWLRAADEYGRRRIDLEKDWVRNEIHDALSRGAPVLPLLVAGAKELPPAEALPEELRALLNHQASYLRDERWADDLDGLIRDLVNRHGFIDNGRRVILPAPEVRVTPLTVLELDESLSTLPGWEPVESMVPGDYPNTRQELRKAYTFRTFKAAVEFMHLAVQPINAVKHHPRWENQWKTVTVYLSTWDIGSKISKLDVELARKLDELYEAFKSAQRSAIQQ